MTFNTDGNLLEGIRVATSNGGFTYPPRTVVMDSNEFNSETSKSEYAIFVNGQTDGTIGIDIGDPNLSFLWTRNNGSVLRFDFDSFAGRWNTKPGSSPDVLGVFGNTPRVIAPVPDLTLLDAPFSLYIGSPVRIVTFSVSLVETAADFTDPIEGAVEIAVDSGQINFSSVDTAKVGYQKLPVFYTRQSFYDRTKFTGSIGNLPLSSVESYALFLNPIPASGQIPRVRIGFTRYLAVTSVLTEAGLTSPAPGTCVFSLDTGRAVFASSDIDNNPDESIYYDGIIINESVLQRGSTGPANFMIPQSVFIGLQDVTKYVFFYSPVGGPGRYFLQTLLGDSSVSTIQARPGYAVIDIHNGNIVLASDDINRAAGVNLEFVNTYVPIERGVSMQVFRSGVNTSGYTTEPDFIEIYAVTKQIVANGIQGSPFVRLTATPVLDVNFAVNVTQGPGGGGTFTGPLVNGSDSAATNGLAYLLNLPSKQLNFAQRKSVSLVLDTNSPSVKLPDSVISERGISVARNGIPIIPGIDFDFDATSGLIEFITPVGEDDTRNVLSISGTFSLPNIFTATTSVFSNSQIGSYLYVASGPNIGFYPISAVDTSNRVFLSIPIKAAGSATVDIRAGVETVADRFWTSFTPPIRKISVEMATDISQVFTKLGPSDFSILASTGQINLTVPAKPSSIYRTTYTSLDSQDNGVTITPQNHVELASFKIRQESATMTVGFKTVVFNPTNDPISSTISPSVYLNGVTLKPTEFSLQDNQTLIMNRPMTADDSVVLDYFVTVATGGNSSYKLASTPVDVDFPTIIGSDSVTGNVVTPPSVFNGDQTSLLKAGGAMLVGEQDVLSIALVIYDPITDSTSVHFSPVPDVTLVNASMQVCEPINASSYRVLETLPIDVISKGTNTITIGGQAHGYNPGTIVFLGQDPYSVISSKYDNITNRTILTLSGNASRNYIITTLSRTVRPILSSSGSFSTNLPAHIGFPFTLVKTGNSSAVLRSGTDYNVSDGGLVQLLEPIGFGDVLQVMYVARQNQIVGTKLDLHYGSAIAPTTTNGLIGQNLVLNYSLYSPDTFYFRIETIVTFIPEVVQLLQQSSSSGSSGPNIKSRQSLTSKDMGGKSLYFDEQHTANVDVVVSRLFQFHNDLVNTYEDLLSNYDGRVVGGTSGRFRYDGNLNNPPRSTYISITNDVDDKVLLYNEVKLTSFFVFTDVPIYAHMYEANSLSRIYPTSIAATAALNNKVGFSDFGATLGSLGIPKIASLDSFTPTAAISTFHVNTALFPNNTTFSTIIIPKNGDTAQLLPQFATSQQVNLFARDGTPDITTTVSSVVTNTDGSVSLGLGAPTSLIEGSVVQVSVNSSSTHIYQDGRDLNVDFNNGQIHNLTLPPFFSSLQNPVQGNELVDTIVRFSNQLTTPKRIPVLDGSLLPDSERPSNPPLFRDGELESLQSEFSALSQIDKGVVFNDLVTIKCTNPVAVGNKIRFLSGPNAGSIRTATTPGTTFTVSVALAVADSSGSPFTTVLSSGDPTVFLAREIATVATNVATPPTPPTLIGTINSEFASLDILIRSFGTTILSSSGITSGPTLTDLSTNFATLAPQIIPGFTILYIASGVNTGTYKIDSFSTHTITVVASDPYVVFPISTSVSYILIQPWQFISLNQQKFACTALNKALNFYNSCITWQGSITPAGIADRTSIVISRIADITVAIQSVTSLLTQSDNLYSARYLWLQQRTDMQNGTVYQILAAQNQRISNTQKLIQDQQKLLALQSLSP